MLVFIVSLQHTPTLSCLLSHVAVAQDVREEGLEVREVRHVLTVVHHSQLTCSAQVRWKDPPTASNTQYQYSISISIQQPEILPQGRLVGVEDNIVPNILAAEGSQHGEEKIEDPAALESPESDTGPDIPRGVDDMTLSDPEREGNVEELR